MHQVFKYALQHGQNFIEMPRNPQFVHFGEQNGTMFIWAIVDSDENPYSHRIDILNTGVECPSQQKGMYLGTIQTEVGRYVYHAFWVRPSFI